MIRAVIVDDESSGIELLSYELNKFDDTVEIVGTCQDSRNALDLILDLKPSVVFLDIEMPWVNGIELAMKLQVYDLFVIFVTAYEKYAIRSFDFFTIDYLLKPVNSNDIKRVISKIEKYVPKNGINEVYKIIRDIRHEPNKMNRIALADATGYQIFNHDDIFHLKADSNYTEVFVSNQEKSILVTKTIGSFGDMLQSPPFFRVHKSYIINVNHMKKYIKQDGGIIVMKNDIRVPLSRSRRVEFLNYLKNLSN